MSSAASEARNGASSASRVTTTTVVHPCDPRLVAAYTGMPSRVVWLETVSAASRMRARNASGARGADIVLGPARSHRNCSFGIEHGPGPLFGTERLTRDDPVQRFDVDEGRKRVPENVLAKHRELGQRTGARHGQAAGAR